MDERSAIADRIGALAVNVDARRWDILLSLFTVEVQLDYTSLFGGQPKLVTRDELIESWRQLLSGFTRTTHLIGLPSINASEDTARVAVPVVAWHFVKDPALAGNDLWLVGGCYEMSFAKNDGVWRIAALTLARAWTEGNADLPRIAGDRAGALRNPTAPAAETTSPNHDGPERLHRAPADHA